MEKKGNGIYLNKNLKLHLK